MKKLTALFLTLALLFVLCGPVLADGEKIIPTSQALTVDGVAKTCEIYNINGYNYFKLRDMAFLLNGTGSQFQVGWDEATSTVSVTTGQPYTPNGSEMEVRTLSANKLAEAGKSRQTILVNGQARSDLGAYLIGDNNFFKLRDLGNALGFNVDYNTETSTMVVESLPFGSGRAVLTAEQIYARCIPAVFLVDVYDAYGNWMSGGSGFFIDGKGTAVTNHHVIYGGTSAQITITDSLGREASYDVLGVYDWSEEEDWAVLKVDVSGNAWLKYGDSSSVVGGAPVYALGSPLGLAASISDGIISNPTRYYDGQTYIQTNAAIDHGSSGGALVNKYGEVIGITCGGFNGQNLNIAIPVTRLAGIHTDTVTPISETYVIATGAVAPAVYQVNLQPGESFVNVITAYKANTDEYLTVQYEIDDPSIVSCAWGEWGPSDTTVDLTVTAKDYGGTYVTVYLYTSDSETLLDYCLFYVSVVGGFVESELSSAELSLGQDQTVMIHAASYDGRSVIVRYELSNEDALSCTWGEWNGDDIPLTLHPKQCGGSYVTLLLLDAEDETVLAESGFYVSIIGGSLKISETEFMLAPGEQKTLTISGAAFDPSVVTRITSDSCESDIIDWKRGELGSGTVTLTVTALAEGWDCIYISLLDSNDNELNYAFIDVYVNMDGKGADE